MNLGLIAPGPHDGTSFYRAVGPFAYLSREYGVRLITAERWDWTNLTQCDAVFLQRPFDNEHGMIAKWCRALNVPLWVDYDDLYSAFPDWTPIQQETYGNPQAAEVMRFCLDVANVITVSTPALADALRRESGTDPVVLPNALNTYLWPMSSLARQPVITWRGSGGHGGDLDPMIGTLRLLAKVHGDWQFHWLGRPHYKCAAIGTVHPYQDLFSYMELFQELAPAIHIVPLADCEFNRCKSNIAWLEASAAGAVTVAPDLPEWRRPGIVRYATQDTKPGRRDPPKAEAPAPVLDSFGDAVSWAIRAGEKKRLALLAESRRFILDHLRLSQVNRQRWEILRGLEGKGNDAAV